MDQVLTGSEVLDTLQLQQQKKDDEAALIAFYERHNPDLVNQVPEIVSQLGGDQHALAAALTKKYGETPHGFCPGDLKHATPNPSCKRCARRKRRKRVLSWLTTDNNAELWGSFLLAMFLAIACSPFIVTQIEMAYYQYQPAVDPVIPKRPRGDKEAEDLWSWVKANGGDAHMLELAPRGGLKLSKTVSSRTIIGRIPLSCLLHSVKAKKLMIRFLREVWQQKAHERGTAAKDWMGPVMRFVQSAQASQVIVSGFQEPSV